MKFRARICFLAVACVSSLAAHAGAYCYSETITSLILQGDEIFFTTDKSCPNWCKLGATWSADATKRGYATMLAAEQGGKLISLYFNELTGVCSGPVPASSSPTVVIAYP